MELESPSTRSGSFSLVNLPTSSPSPSSSSLFSTSPISVPPPPPPPSTIHAAKHNKIGSLFMFKFKSFNALSSDDLKQLTPEGRK